MAQSAALQSDPKANDNAAPPEASRAISAKRNEISQSLAKYQSEHQPASHRRDLVDNRFAIHLNQPLPELNTTLNRAYAVTDETDPGASCYALVCDIRTPQRVAMMAQLRTFTDPHFITPINAGLVELSTTGEQRLAVIFLRPKGVRLSTLITQIKIPLTESFIRSKIITPIAMVLNQMEELGLSHGRLNPDNIFFDEYVTLGECVSEPCGYSQIHTFETVERMICSPGSKGEGDITQDYYALGVLLLMMFPGKRQFASLDVPGLSERLLSQGAYNAMTMDEAVSDTFNDFLRGTLHENKRDRWTYSQLKSWSGGKKFNVITPAIPVESSRPYQIGDGNYLNRRALAYGLIRNLDKATEALRDGSIIRWIELSIGNKEIAEMLRRIVKYCGGESNTNIKANEELLARACIILDPHGAIRIQDFCFNIDGLGAALCEFMSTHDELKLRLIHEIFDLDLANTWSEMQKQHLDTLLSTAITTTLWKLDRLRIMLRNKGLGFGMERCLYELNPYLPCQSPLLEGKHVTTLPQLLMHLDRIAPQKSHDSQPMDRHIAAFIASRLNIMREIRITQLEDNKQLAKHPALITLKLLEQAQNKGGKIRVPGLSAWIAMSLFSVIEHINSKTLREHVETMLANYASSGVFQPMMEVMQSTEYVAHDKAGLQAAKRQYYENLVAIETLKSRTYTKIEAARIGDRIAKLITYGVLGTVLYFMSLSGFL